eukprot:scaffold3425_cov65-Phaeocystis_antarctica.AAC.1
MEAIAGGARACCSTSARPSLGPTWRRLRPLATRPGWSRDDECALARVAGAHRRTPVRASPPTPAPAWRLVTRPTATHLLLAAPWRRPSLAATWRPLTTAAAASAASGGRAARQHPPRPRRAGAVRSGQLLPR